MVCIGESLHRQRHESQHWSIPASRTLCCIVRPSNEPPKFGGVCLSARGKREDGRQGKGGGRGGSGHYMGLHTPLAELCSEVWREMETLLPTAAISVEIVLILPRRIAGRVVMFIWSGVCSARLVGAPITNDMSMFCC